MYISGYRSYFAAAEGLDDRPKERHMSWRRCCLGIMLITLFIVAGSYSVHPAAAIFNAVSGLTYPPSVIVPSMPGASHGAAVPSLGGAHTHIAMSAGMQPSSHVETSQFARHTQVSSGIPKAAAAVAMFAFIGLAFGPRDPFETQRGSGKPLPEPEPSPITGRAIVIFAVWAAFLAYAYTSSPGGSPEAQAVDLQLATEIFSDPSKANPIFLAIFNSLGIVPACYAAILLPGSKDQRPLPALPFVVGSFALGFFALGPYLALRQLRFEAEAPRGWFAKSLESKITAAILLASGIGLWAYAGGFFGGAAPGQWQQFLELFGAQRLVNVSSLDLCILSTLFPFTVIEDMKRRGWFQKGDGEDIGRLLLFSIPVVGPAAYLLLRPKIDS